jgi:nucleotide-binding universal stress UspA family protein
MTRILVAVDGSAPSDRAVKHVVGLQSTGAALRVLLLNVQPRWAPALSEEDAAEGRRLHQQAATRALRSARALLEQAKTPYETRMLVGDAAEHIVKLARTQRCSHIVLGRRGRSAMARVVLGSVSMKVLQLADRPVTLVK